MKHNYKQKIRNIIYIFMVLTFIFPLFILNIADVYAGQGVVYYVKSNKGTKAWANKDKDLVFNDLQEAIDRASRSGGGRVFIAIGEYSPQGFPNKQANYEQHNKHFSLKNNVRVIGGFKGTENNGMPMYRKDSDKSKQTIITGNDETENLFYHPQKMALDNSAILENITLTKGGLETSQGGAIYNAESSPLIIDCTFMENKGKSGGAIYNFYSASKVINCSFIKNNSKESGGALYNENSQLEIKICDFKENISGMNGGAIGSIKSQTMLWGNNFEKNTSQKDGGSIYVEDCQKTDILNTMFTENKSEHYGGSLYSKNSNTKTENCLFTGNNGLYGGGMYGNNAIFLVTNTTFLANGGSDGGAIYGENSSKITLVNDSFVKNRVYEKGGALFSYIGNLKAINCYFAENSANIGGGIYTSGGASKAVNSIFKVNHGKNGGGGIYSCSAANSDSTLKMVNITLADNTALSGSKGGGVYSDDYSINIANSIISGNENGEGISDFYREEFTGTSIIKNSVISNDFYITENDIKSNTFDPTKNFDETYCLTGTENIAIDNGENQLLFDEYKVIQEEISPNKKISVYDLEGKERIAGLSLDLGPFENNAPKGEVSSPAPTIYALEGENIYNPGDKTNSSVYLYCETNLSNMENFPLVRKTGYLPFNISYDDQETKIYNGPIYGDDSQYYSFWSICEGFTNSQKIPFEININKFGSKVEKFEMQDEARDYAFPITADNIKIIFSKPIRSTGSSNIKLYNIETTLDGANKESKGIDLTADSTFDGNNITVNLANGMLKYGQKYKIIIAGYKDDFDNIMTPYSKYFIVEVSPDNYEPTISGIDANKYVLESYGGPITITAGGNRINYMKNITFYCGNISANGAVDDDGKGAIATNIVLPENNNEESKIYTFGVKSDDVDWGKFINITVEGKGENIGKSVEVTDDFSGREYVKEESPKSNTVMESVNIIVNGSPYKTQTINVGDGLFPINLSSVEGRSTVVISNEILKNIKKDNEDFKFKIISPWGVCFLPVNIGDIIPAFKDALSNNGLKEEDVYIKVYIEDILKKQEFSSVLKQFGKTENKAVGFKIEVIGEEGKIINDVSILNKKIMFMIPGENGFKSPYSSVFYSHGEDDEIRFAPHKTVTDNGQKYLEIKGVYCGNYFVGTNEKDFDDITSHWGRREIKEAASLGIVNGLQNGQFAPEKEITRGEFIQMLSTALNLPKVYSDKSYVDVSEEDWYFDAVSRAKAAGILDGFADETFEPNQPVTREEGAFLLNTAALMENANENHSFELKEEYSDHEQISEMYYSDVANVGGLGIMRGKDVNIFGPKDEITRGEVAFALMRTLRVIDYLD